MKTARALFRAAAYSICLLLLFLLSAKTCTAQMDGVNEPQKASVKAAVEGALVEAPETPRTFKQRFYDYRTSTFSVWSLFTPSLGAGISQARNFPPEWKQGSEGFGKRVASGYGSVVIENTISLGFSHWDHADLRYPRSDYPKSAILKRVGHAIAFTFVPLKEGGGRRIGWSRFTGDYGAGFIANTWYPAKHSDMKNALYLGSINLAGDLGVNLLKEFIRPHVVFGASQKTSATKNRKDKAGG